MKGKLAMKRKLAMIMAIALLVIFGVETMAVASPDSNSHATTTQNKQGKCPGDDKDEC